MGLLGIEIDEGLETSPPYVMVTVARPVPFAAPPRKNKPCWRFW